MAEDHPLVRLETLALIGIGGFAGSNLRFFALGQLPEVHAVSLSFLDSTALRSAHNDKVTRHGSSSMSAQPAPVGPEDITVRAVRSERIERRPSITFHDPRDP